MNRNAHAHRFATHTTSRAGQGHPFTFTGQFNVGTPGVFHFGASEPRADNYRRAAKQRRKTGRKAVRPAHPSKDRHSSTSCNICMETVRGNVTLKCGHEMCPECYAKHSRVNNACPYCRDVFAPEVEKASSTRIPNEEAETIVDGFVREYFFEDVKEELTTLLKDTDALSEDQINDIQLSVYCHLYQVSINTYHLIDEWIDDNE